MVHYFSCLFIFLGLSLTVVNAGRPTLQAAKQTIPKLECRLYQECNFELKLKELINTYKTSVNSSDTKIFRFVSQQLNETKPSERLEKLDIQVIPVQVGRAILKAIAQNGTEIELAQVVIIRPNRGIDIAFDVFLWVYVGLVSFAMGAAIHRDLIRDFLTGNRQKEVSVSFFCQYFIMPIVIFHFFSDHSNS